MARPSTTTEQPLPKMIQAWISLMRRHNFRGRTRIGVSLVRWGVKPGVPYVGADGIVLEIDPSDHFQATMMLGTYDEDTRSAVRKFAAPDSIVMDVGAHFGYISLEAGLAVGRAGEVHAFECDPRLVGRLERHIRLNRMPWIRAFPFAVSRITETVDLLLPQQLGWATLRGDTHLTVTQKARVSSVSIDDHVARTGVDPARVSFMKVDVEGAEMDVLKGAVDMITQSDAAIEVEVMPLRMKRQGESPEDMIRFFRDTGRAAWVIRGGMLRKYDGGPEVNIIFVRDGHGEM